MSEVHAAQSFCPGSCGGRGKTPAGPLAPGPGSRGVVAAAALPGPGATSRVPGPRRRELGERRAAQLAGRPLAPPAARRDPPTPRPPAAARTAHSPAAAAAAAARRPAPARRRRRAPGPRDAAGRAPDPATHSRGRAAPRRRRERRARAAWPGPVKGTSCKQFRK